MDARAMRSGPATLRRALHWAVLLSVAPALVGNAWGWLCAHPPRLGRASGEPLDRDRVRYRELVLKTADGLELAAWYTPPANGVLILIGHGYHSWRSAELHALFARNGFGALSWDFRAHGRSEGSLCTVGYLEALDVEAALDYALARPEVGRVGLWGGSMGGIAGLRAALQRPEIEALVLDSVPSSLVASLENAVRPDVLRPIVRRAAEREAGLSMDLVRPASWMRELDDRPVLIIQGLSDRLIPLDSGRELWLATGRSAELWLVPGAGHLAAQAVQPRIYERQVVQFFAGALAAP